MRNYFDGTVSDGTSKMRMIGFNSKQRTMMNEFSEKRETVILKDCQIQQARRGHDMEVLLKNTTQILQSPKVLSVSNFEFETNAPTTISLQELEQRNIYERITVTVKVSKKFAPELVATGKKKQDIIVCDATGTGSPFGRKMWTNLKKNPLTYLKTSWFMSTTPPSTLE